MDYAYDNNGNLIEDYNKSIENISYNYLNLPQRIWFGNGDSITYIYDAAGVKHAKFIDGSETGDRYYIGNMEYNQAQTLEFIHTDEGRVRYNGVDYAYDYYLKDHLGNTRVSFTESTTTPNLAEALQVDNYYPFGMRFNQAPILQVEENNYLYNGKELQENYGLDWYDYGWRHYDAALGRWHVVDPLATKYYSISPYNYVANNPLRYIDPDGMKIGNPRSEDAKRYKKSMKRTKTGRKVYRGMKRSSKTIYIHYVEDGHEGIKGKLENHVSGANGQVFSGSEFKTITSDGELNFREHHTFNEETGMWEPNDKNESHVVINESSIENDVDWLSGGEYTDEDLDVETHGIEVHEGQHTLQEGYDYTETVENSDGTHTDTGIYKSYGERTAEKDAKKKQNTAKEELKNE